MKTRARLVWLFVVFAGLMGVIGFWVMPRQEDPSMRGRFGLIVATYPGADAAKVERLVLDPIEEELAEIADIRQLKSSARADVAVINVELRDDVDDIDGAFDEIDTALARVMSDLPDGVRVPTIERDLHRTASVLLAITGTEDRLALAEAAEQTKKRLLRVDDVSEVQLVADPGEQITISFDEAAAARLGLPPEALGAQLASRNTALPGGAVQLGERRATLRPNSELEDIATLAATPIALPSGGTVPLSSVATIRRTVLDPEPTRMRIDGQTAVGLAVIPHEEIHLVNFGEEVRAALGDLESELAPLKVTEVAFQPTRVSDRLGELSGSLLVGIGIVAAVLIIFMGGRLGLLVASVVPLVAAASVATFAAGGGILQQISIAALVLALGMLVDNAIVVAEGVQRRIDDGEDRWSAATNTVKELWVPLAAATGTTLAAFVPMLLSKGPTGEFTRSIPIVLMLSLTISYIFAVVVTPLAGAMVLRPNKQTDRINVFDRLAGQLGQWVSKRRRLVLVGAFLLVAGSGSAITAVEQQFFPASDRNQLVVSMELPEGTHLTETDDVSRAIEARLASHPNVRGVSAFVGESAPKFYYNLPTLPQQSHLAQLIVETTSPADVEGVAAFVRAEIAPHYPQAQLVARGLEQGPPVAAPIELRLVDTTSATSAETLTALHTATEKVIGVVRGTPGARDIRHTGGAGTLSLKFDVDDAIASDFGANRNDVAQALLGRTRGLPVGELRDGADPVPIVVRSAAGDRIGLDQLAATNVGTRRAPIAQVAETSVAFGPAVIEHHESARTVRVLAELDPSVPFSKAIASMRPQLDALELPDGVELQIGGAAEGSGRANSALLTTLPIGLFLLVFILLAEFNSWRRVMLVLVTVPLAATGVIPGLVVSGQPFGFMSMLGVFALIGIVVNNAIVLIDVTDRLRADGVSLNHAVAEAIRLRTRPILLTTMTTIAGLLPLALSETSLWPPLAWSMISGLLASTVLTLLVVPSLYSVLFRREAITPAGQQADKSPVSLPPDGQLSPAQGT